MIAVQTATEPKCELAVTGLHALTAFHGQIRRAMRALDSLAAWYPSDADPFVAKVLFNFFTGPLLEHDDDEEELLAPAIMASAHPAFLDSALAACTEQHRAMEGLLEAILPHLGDVAARREEANPVLLTTAAVELRALLEPHLLFEEQQIYPMARGLLTASEMENLDQALTARQLQRLQKPTRGRHYTH